VRDTSTTSPAVEQRKSEALAAYAAMPPAQHLKAFLQKVGIAKGTWIQWQYDPTFAARLDAIRRERATVDFEPFWSTLGQSNDALTKKCVMGDVAALRTMYELLGYLKQQQIRIQNVIDASRSTTNVQSSDEELEELIASGSRTRDLILRRVERADVPEDDPGPAGPGHNGGAPA